jgi:addiction module HigA family antidote
MNSISDVAPNMKANNLEPCYPTHPGEVLKDEIEYRGISQKVLATAMDIPYTLLNEVLNGKRQLTAELALLIEATLDLPAEPSLKMQARYNMLVTKRNVTFADKLSKIRKIAAVF